MNLPDTDKPPFSQQEIEFLQVLAFLYLQNNQSDEAAALLKAADHAGSCDGYALIILALAQLHSGTAVEALATLDRVQVIPALEASYHVARSKVLAALGRTEESKVAMRTYVQVTNAHKTHTKHPY